MARDYPNILIDRNRLSKNDRHKFDYIVCLDRECGFIARVVAFTREAFNEFKRQTLTLANSEYTHFPYLFKSGKLAVVLVVEDFLYKVDFNIHGQRIKSLLNKCMKKYLHSEAQMIPKVEDEVNYDSQIKAMENIMHDVLESKKQMVSAMGEDGYEFYRSNVAASIDSIKMLQSIIVGKTMV